MATAKHVSATVHSKSAAPQITNEENRFLKGSEKGTSSDVQTNRAMYKNVPFREILKIEPASQIMSDQLVVLNPKGISRS